MKMNKLFITLLSTLACTSIGHSAYAKTVWDLPSAYPDTNMHTQILEQFSKDIEKATEGEFTIKLHSNASLFKATEIKRAVQKNQAQAGEILLTNFANEDPQYELDGLPFLATGYDDAWKLYQAQKPYLEKLLDKQGMKLLYSIAWPPQGIFVNKKIDSVADMEGLKWRAYSPVTARIAQAVKANPVTIQQAELTQALATGVVNSFMTSSATGYDIKVYEYIKYYYDNEAWLPRNAVFANKKEYEKLSDSQKEALLEAAEKAEKEGWELSREKTEFYKNEMTKNGLEILQPSEKLQQELTKIGEDMVNEWLKKAGDDGQKILDEFRK